MPDHQKQDYCNVAAADAAVMPSMLWLVVAGTSGVCSSPSRMSVVRLFQLLFQACPQLNLHSFAKDPSLLTLHRR